MTVEEQTARGQLERIGHESETRTAATAAALTGLAAASWVVAVHRMDGMDMGVATELGSFAFFVAAWVPMMAAMMLPARFRQSRASFAPTVVRSPRCCSPGRISPSGQWWASPSTRCTGRTAPPSRAR